MCDIDEFKSPNILFLGGVYFRSCKDVGDMLDDRLTEMAAFKTDSDQQGVMPPANYDTIPQLFHSPETWIKFTNIWCWQCGCMFQWSPIFVPTSITKSGTKPGEYMPIKPIGNFCSFLCAGDWIKLYIPKDKQWEKIELLKLMHKICTGDILHVIPKGVNKTKMTQFGGLLTTADYQARIKLISSQSNITYPPEMFTGHVTPEDAKLTSKDMLL
jgi:hypothetical protein